MYRDWSGQEVEATVRDYLDMLASELRGVPYNKAAHNRALRARLDDRTHGAVERKHQNISAVLIELGFPYINGYKPLRNIQNMLRDVVLSTFRRLRTWSKPMSRQPRPQSQSPICSKSESIRLCLLLVQ